MTLHIHEKVIAAEKTNPFTEFFAEICFTFQQSFAFR